MILQRYPSASRLTIPVFEDKEENGIIGVSEKGTKCINLKGRFEFTSRRDTDYKAVFYVSKSDEKLKDVVQDHASLEYEGRTYNVLRILVRQSNTVIWLN